MLTLPLSKSSGTKLHSHTNKGAPSWSTAAFLPVRYHRLADFTDPL